MVLGVNLGQVCVSLSPAGGAGPGEPIGNDYDYDYYAGGTGPGVSVSRVRGDRREVEADKENIATSRQRGVTTSFSDAKLVCQV